MYAVKLKNVRYILLIIVFTGCHKVKYGKDSTVAKLKIGTERVPFVILHDETTEYRAIVDTGAPESLIFFSGLKKLIQDHPMQIDYTKETEITIAGNIFGIETRRNILYNPQFFEMYDTDGVVGRDVLTIPDFTVIDYRRKQLIFCRERPDGFFWLSSGENRTGCELTVRMQGVDKICLLDTGSPDNMLLDGLPVYPKVYKRMITVRRTAYAENIKTENNVYYLRNMSISTKRLPSMFFYDVKAYAGQLFDGVDQSCLLGYDFFKNWTVCLDNRNKRIGIRR